ncbi:MAG: hypothetical protein SOZ34_04415 [Clostridia bacterium]|nr:hypothetical protein [Clostridia bacterium]
MTDIRIYDFEFNLLCIMSNVVSSQWHILYNDIGTYEGHFRINDNVSNIILTNKYIVLTQGDNQAICTGKIVSDELIVCGRTVNWILSRRVRPPFKTREIFGETYTDPETILLYCLKKGFTEPPQTDENGLELSDTVDKDRKIDNFVLPQAIGAQQLTNHFWRITAHEISKLVIQLCEKLDRGHEVVFDIKNHQWVFNFLYSKVNEILISKESKTACDVSYTEDLLNFSDNGWYSEYNSESEDQSTWHLLKKGNTKGIYAWDSVLNASGQSEAEDELQKRRFTQTIEAKLRNLSFRKDYNLGDIIPVYVKFGSFEKMSKYKITGVNIKITPTDSYEEPILTLYEN